ncbi:TetR/AcrR family transcriptional regulator [Nonomuraea sp. NBC_01738]|uniref:TetR/AcrR family transcriptional regulator n=1 Tax=Nonomuraea sp. NBC_01738 TaxID=2976003 RepID=UPI002E0DF1C3|nr:TetR/AcrR family transcriptional regulator [Nonomuraea sp. NBC_01738]
MIVKFEALTARGRRTRAALVEAGRQAFEEHAYDAVRIDDVCARAQVSHGTFYTYFDSKEALFGEVASAVVGEMFTASVVGPGVTDEPYARIEAANRLYLRAWAGNSRLVRMLEQAASDDDRFGRLLLELREVFVRRGADGLRRLQEQGLADPTLDPRLTAIMLGGMVEHFAHVWIDLGESADERTAVDLLTKLWARAIGLTPTSTPLPTPLPTPPATPSREREGTERP